MNLEISLPENEPVRLASAQLEELDYTNLYKAYSSKGRKSAVEPRVMFKVMAYAYQQGIFSSRKIEEACRYRVDFKWLLEDHAAPDHTTISRFRTGRCMGVVEELFYQYIRKLEEWGATDHETVFIDGTKLESRAGRYTFVWKKSVEKYLEKVKKDVFAATGIRTLPELRNHLECRKEQISFVHGIGHRKSAAQKEWEALEKLCNRWEFYEYSLGIMGDSRNSYSKTDPDATFMRMKDDHMRNGQLKPAYNVQVAVNSEFITGIDAFSNRTDFGTLQPFLRTMQRFHEAKYEEVTADSGYESLDNYLFLERNGQMSFIKPSNYDQRKTKKFKKQIGRIENMSYDLEEDCFTCAEGRKLPLHRESTERTEDGQFISTAWYRCEDCTNCPRRTACCRAKDVNTPKELRLQKTFREKRAESLNHITTERGILLRMCRSIQAEGTFGLLKNDFGFRRFLTAGKVKIRIELFFLALGFNLKKYWMKREHDRLSQHLSTVKLE